MVKDKKDKKTNNDLQNSTQKTKGWAIQTHLCLRVMVHSLSSSFTYFFLTTSCFLTLV
jgi:hypothetical protein